MQESKMQHNREVSLMRPEELDQVAELEQMCFSDPWLPGMLADTVSHSYDWIFVWREEDRVAGYGILRILGDEGEIQRIGVAPHWRGRGIGRKLMEGMLGFSREKEAAAVALEVRQSNEPAIQLYQSCGFVKEAVRKGYYHNPSEDAWIFWNRKIQEQIPVSPEITTKK